MDNSENHDEQQIKISETYSFAWYPTQCDMKKAVTTTTSNNSLSQGAYRVVETDGNEELVVVEQRAPELGSQNSSQQYVINIGNKFTDQQVKVLMKSWKELCDKRQHIRTCDSDWHDITDRVNMAPGTAKTVKQVKKKFKNLRDRYRAFKLKNKKRNFGFSKSFSFSHFEQVYGEMDSRQIEAPRRTRNNALNMDMGQGGTTVNDNKFETNYAEEHTQPPKRRSTLSSTTCRSSFNSGGKTIPRQKINDQLVLTSNDVIAEHVTRENISHSLHAKAKRAVSSSDEKEYHMGTTPQRIVTSHGGCQVPNKEAGNLFDSGLASAVRELQQQQITMQRELMRSMKQMEERIMQEIASRTHESEDRFRQQIANALTQLGNLMRII